MNITEKGSAWEWKNSLWIIWTFIYPVNWIAFFYIGLKAEYKKWVLFGWVYFVLIFGFGIFSTTLPQLQKLFVSISLILLPVSIIHAFMLKNEYLIRREAVENNNSNAQEKKSSRWIIWVFIYPINWLAFFYIGAKAKCKKWLLFGCMYFVLIFGFGMLSGDIPYLKKLFISVSIVSWVVSIIHAFTLRREYLIRNKKIIDNIKDTVNVNKNNTSVPSNSLDDCKADIEKYLDEYKSTPFFREKLFGIAWRINTFSSHCDNVKNIIIERFGSAGLSYDKFAAPVEALRDYLIKLTNSLVMRMNMFNEEEYSSRIGAFAKENRADDAAGYIELEQEYKDYAQNTLSAFDDAILKLDRLMLEISKISDTDVEIAMNIMSDLDSAIKDTQFYK